MLSVQGAFYPTFLGTCTIPFYPVHTLLVLVINADSLYRPQQNLGLSRTNNISSSASRYVPYILSSWNKVLIRFDLGVTLGFGIGVTNPRVCCVSNSPFHFSNKSENNNNNNDNNDVKFE